MVELLIISVLAGLPVYILEKTGFYKKNKTFMNVLAAFLIIGFASFISYLFWVEIIFGFFYVKNIQNYYFLNFE